MTDAAFVPVLAASGGDAATLFLELGAVLLGLAVMARLADRAGLSPIPLYLIAGLSFGEGGIWHLEASEQFIEIGGQMGVVLLLLLLGLEYSADELTQSLRANAAPGVLDLVLNATPGVVAGVLLGFDGVAVVALGAVTYISSSGVVAKLLDDFDRTANRETPTVLSILVIEDLVMAVYLPVLAGLLVGGGVAATGASVGVALVAVAVALGVAVRFGDHISRVVFSRNDEALLLTILGVTLLIAGLAEGARVSAAVGAFLVGLAMSGHAAHHAAGMLTPLRDVFAATFFLFFGFGIDAGELGGVAVPAVALAAVTTATKVGTGWWAARRAGVATYGRFRAGTVLVARGEFSIVVAGLVVASGQGGDLGLLAAAYVLVLAVVGPVLTRFSDPLCERLVDPWRDRRAARVARVATAPAPTD